MSKRIYYLIQTVLVLGITMLVYWGWITFFPYKPLIVRRPPAIENSPVTPGDTVIYDVDYCRKGNYSAQVSRTITGTIIIPTPIVNTITTPGCRVAKVPLLIPVGTPDGTYHIEISAEFKVNPMRTVIVKFATEDFQVLNKK